MPIFTPNLLRNRFAGCVCLLMFATAHGAEVSWVKVERDGSEVDIRSEFVIAAPVDRVHAALLDYDRFSEHGDTFAESRYVAPAADGTPRIYTRTEGCIWFYCKTIERTARLEVQANQTIIATAEPERSDAARSVESWTLTAQGNVTVVSYRHDLDTGFFMPPLLGSLVINRSIKTGARKAAARIEAMATTKRPSVQQTVSEAQEPIVLAFRSPRS